MIAHGGPRICGECRTLMHEPNAACPAPYVADPGEFDPFEVARRER